jgi:uncharacterized membrane protein YraQ (UPF0718 family)
VKKTGRSKIIQYTLVVIVTATLITLRILEVPGLEKISSDLSSFLLEIALFLPCIFILVGLFDVWVPREKIQRHIGDSSGLKGMLLVILLAMLQAGPLYGAFPVAALLHKKGASVRNIFIYLGAFSCLKLPMLAFEITFLGLKFSLLRTAITLPVFILIGELMALLLKKKGLTINSPEA